MKSSSMTNNDEMKLLAIIWKEGNRRWIQLAASNQSSWHGPYEGIRNLDDGVIAGSRIAWILCAPRGSFILNVMKPGKD